MRPLHRPRDPRRQNSALAAMAQGSPRSLRRRQHQQCRRRHELRHARARPRAACFRLRQGARPSHRGSSRQAQRKNSHPRWHRARARPRHLHDLRWRRLPRRWHRRHHGRRRNRDILLHQKCLARVRLVRPHRHSPRHAHPQTAHRSLHPLRPRCRSRNGRARFAPLRRAHPAARQGAARLPHYEAEARLRERLIGLGYREILTIPHVAEDRDALFRPPDVQPARLANPLSEEANVLKSTGIVTMTAALEWNLNRGQRNVRLFEIGRQSRLRGSESVEIPILTLGATGRAREKGLYDTAREYSFADLKGDIDALGALAGGFTWNERGPAWLHPARRGRIALHNGAIGAAGELTRRVAEQLKLRQEIFLAELQLPPLYAVIRAAKESRKYEPVPRFPAVERDFSLLLGDGTHFSDVAGAIRSLNILEIVSIEAIDLYRGKNVPAGQYSLLVRVTFQSREATLTEAQLTDFSARIIAALEKQLSARLRAS